MSQKASIEITGAMDLIKRSKYLLAPVFEAITNSLEAIANRENKLAQGSVIINFYFTGIVTEAKTLEKIEIIDNGEGFNNKSFERFITLLDKSKGFNNRGSGRMQFLHRFNEINVVSTYTEDEKIYTRKFFFNSNDFVSKPELSENKKTTPIETKLTMSGFKADKKEQSFFDLITSENVKNEIQKRFLLKLYLEEQKNKNAPLLKVCFFKNGELESSSSINPKDIPQPEKGKIQIPYHKIITHGDSIEWSTIPEKQEELEWAHFKLPQSELDQTGVFLCSKDVAIQEIPFLKLKKGEALGGNKYLTAIYGKVLDSAENVSQSVDAFMFPTQKQIEKEAKEDLFFNREDSFLLVDTIESQVKNTLSKIYTDIDAVKQEQSTKVGAIAQAHGISEDIVSSTNIDLSDSEEKITEKLYKKQAEENSKKISK